MSTSQLRSLVHGVNVILPVQMSQTIDEALHNPAKGAGAGVEIGLGLAVALWSAVEAMAALQVGLDVAFEVPSDRGFVRRRLVAVPLVVLTLVLGGAASGLLVLGDPIRALLPPSFALARSTFDATWAVTRWAGAMALVVAAPVGVLLLRSQPDEEPDALVEPRIGGGRPGLARHVGGVLVLSGSLRSRVAHLRCLRRAWRPCSCGCT